MLHIRCGDDILGKLKEAGLPGEFIRWADALCQGPTPVGLRSDEWRNVRARFVADRYGATYEGALRCLADQDSSLETYLEHEEILFWFEHDLFDQVVLLYLLNWFAERDLENKKLWLICIGTHLGNLGREQLAALYGTHHRVMPAEIELARKAWRAFCAPDPREIEHFLQQDTSALPFLRKALIRHLQEYPWVRNGLSLTERLTLEVIASGETRPAFIFREVQNREEAAWLGDTMFWPYLNDMAADREPLLTIDGDGPWVIPGTHASGRSVRITRRGRAVLAGEDDWMRTGHRDRWLGGVHLGNGNSLWRWDERQQRVTR